MQVNKSNCSDKKDFDRGLTELERQRLLGRADAVSGVGLMFEIMVKQSGLTDETEILYFEIWKSLQPHLEDLLGVALLDVNFPDSGRGAETQLRADSQKFLKSLSQTHCTMVTIDGDKNERKS